MQRAHAGRATQAVLFTDLVGSTELRVRLGEDAADRFSVDCEQQTRDVVAASGGSVVKGTGDGLLATFDSTTNALDAAAAIQRTSRHPMRVGISVGEVTWHDGDCFGRPVVEAARLVDRAQSGQVLMADLVRVLAQGRGGHQFEALEQVDLKGLPGPLEVCLLRWEPEAAPAPGGLRFAVLGPLVVRGPAGPVELRGRMVRKLVGALLVRWGNPVSTSELVEALWGDHPPSGAEVTVRSHVHRARARLGEGSISAHDGRYRLVVERSDVDAWELEDAVRSGDADRLLAAVSAWRGLPYDELVDWPPAQAAVSALSELRQSAWEQWIESEFGAGRFAVAVSRLEGLVSEFPLHERFWAQLVVALRGAGRPAEGLRAYERARRILADELGALPGPELRAAEAAVHAAARQVPSEPSIPSGLRLPSRLEAFAPEELVGRDRELLRLSLQWEHARGGPARLSLVSGEPGIGKTGLAAAFAREVVLGDGRVVYGRCDDGLGIPYLPWAEIAEVLAGPDGANPLAGALNVGRDEPGAAPSDPQAQQFLMFRAVGKLLGEASRGAPLLVVVDDLHWADRPTLQLVRYLAESAGLRDTLFLCTFRNVDPGPGSALLDLIESAARDPTVDWLTLDGLVVAEVAQLARRYGSARSAETLRKETNGNAFFLNELLRHESETATEGTVPGTVRQIVTQRIGRLGPVVRDALQLGAVIGRELSVELVADGSGIDEQQVLDALDAAVAGGLVVNPSPERYEFAHALVAATLYGELSETRRARAHRRVAEVLTRSPEPVTPAELARHWLAAGERAQALAASRAAGDHALGVFAPSEAAAWYARALELASDDPALRCELGVLLGSAQRQAGIADHETTLSVAFEEARRLGRGDLMADAALASTRLGTPSHIGQVDETQVGRLDQAINALGPEPSPRRARLLSLLAVELSYDADTERRNGAARASITTARLCRDPTTLLVVLVAAIEGLRSVDTLAERLELSSELVGLAEHCSDQSAQFWAFRDRVNVLDEAGDWDEAGPLVERLIELAARLNQPTIHVAAGWAASKRAWLAGDLDAAERWARDMGRQAQLAGHPDAETNLASSMVPIMKARRISNPASVAILERVAAGGPVMGDLARSWLAVMHLGGDRPVEAASLVASAAARGFSSPHTQLWGTMMAQWCTAVADLRDAAAARIIDPLIQPFAHQFVANSSQNYGSFHHYLGLLAATRNEHALADERFSAALDAHRRIRAPHHIADTQLAWAESRLVRPVAEADSARSLWLQAIATAQRHNFVELERRGRLLAEQFPAALA
ncbi:MAG: BTAD domain-containing putative transcriptional regulator [Acidimicrobiales bacterium]